MNATALRTIEAELLALASDPDPVPHEAVRHAARRIAAQAEMIEEGLAE